MKRQFILILVLALLLCGCNAAYGRSPYKTINVSEWSMLEVLWALENKIYSPENQMLNPQGAAARYIVAEMLCKFCNAYETNNR